MATEIILKGVVQGVCCRMYCRQVGHALGIRGAATNLYNGDVQVILATEDEDQVKLYIAALLENSLGFYFYGNITDANYKKYSGAVDGDYIW